MDTNVFIYAASDHPELGETSRRILKRIEEGEQAFTSSLVLLEVAWVLEAKGMQGSIKVTLEKILSYEYLEVEQVRVDDLLVGASYMSQSGLDFNDAVNLAVMERRGCGRVYTNDRRHLGRVEHIEAVFE